MTPYMANVVWSVMDDEKVVWLKKPIGQEMVIVIIHMKKLTRFWLAESSAVQKV